MRRYFITLGAPTSAGGQVISASSGALIDGLAIALEGDLVACPQCRSTGKICCVGPRIPETWNGRNVALENDVCSCKCEVPPRLMTSQVLRSQVIKDSGRALSNPASGVVAPGAAERQFAERFQLIDEENGQPVHGREYAVVRGSGKLEFGTSDALGMTHQLSATAQPEVVELYVQGTLFAASLISPSGTVLYHRTRARTSLASHLGVQGVRIRSNVPTAPALPAADNDELTFLPETGS